MDTGLIYKWKRKDGSILSVNEYKSIFQSAKIKKIPLKNYLASKGIYENLSFGEIQEPKNNSAKLVSWVKENEEGNIALLTQWKYTEYLNEAKEKGIKSEEILRSNGFIKLNELSNGDKKDSPTRWVDLVTGKILYRKEYLKLFSKAKEKNIPIGDFLENIGFSKLLDSKRHME